MEMLNYSTLLSGGLWTTLINVFADWLVNYGWTIVVFTVCLKLVLSPMDFFQRRATQKQSKVMAAMQPEIDAINKKYEGNKERINQETSKIYQKYKVGIGGMCLIMLITLAVSLTVFLTLFSSIRSYGSEKLNESYAQVEQAYTTAYNSCDEGEEESFKEAVALASAKEKYNQIKDQNSWLWVKNVWIADSNESQFVDWDTYSSSLNLQGDDKDAQLAARKEIYTKITDSIKLEEGDTNGNYVLIVITVLVSLGAQLLSSKVLAPKGQKLTGMNKFMMITIPISMALFAYNSNVVFTLYTITNSLMTALISTILTLIFRAKSKDDNPQEILLKRRDVQVVEYSRNYKK